MSKAKPSIHELLAQLPETDKELAAKLPPPTTEEEKRKRRREGDPDPGGAGSKFTAPDPETMNRMAEQVLSGGESSLRELISLIQDPAARDFKDYKAEYLLHCVAVYATRKISARKLVVKAITSPLSNGKALPGVQSILIRELQWLGGPEATKVLGNLLARETVCPETVTALVAIQRGAAEQLRKALPHATGQCRVHVVQGLGALRDNKSAEALRDVLASAEGELRLTTAWALSEIGDVGSTDALLKTATSATGYDQVKLTQACLRLAENLAQSGKKREAARIYTALQQSHREPKQKYVREVAARSLAALNQK